MGVVYRNKSRRAMSGVNPHPRGPLKATGIDIERHWAKLSGEEAPIAGDAWRELEQKLYGLPTKQIITSGNLPSRSRQKAHADTSPRRR